MKEADQTKKLKYMLEKRGAIVIPMVAGMRSMPGLPDRYVSHRGFRGWVECKAGDNRLSKIQVHVCTELLKRGETIVVMRFKADGTWATETVGGDVLCCSSPDRVVEQLLVMDGKRLCQTS